MKRPSIRDDARLRAAGFSIWRHDAHGRTWRLGQGRQFFTAAQAHGAVDSILANHFKHVSPGLWHFEAEENTFTTSEALDHIELLTCELARYETLAE